MGLENSDLLAGAGGLRWFPWVGTRCLRTISILAELNGVTCETDRISIWLPLSSRSEFLVFAERVLSARIDPRDLGSRVTPRVVEKFDEFLPDDLLTKGCASERLALQEALASFKSAKKGAAY